VAQVPAHSHRMAHNYAKYFSPSVDIPAGTELFKQGSEISPEQAHAYLWRDKLSCMQSTFGRGNKVHIYKVTKTLSTASIKKPTDLLAHRVGLENYFRTRTEDAWTGNQDAASHLVEVVIFSRAFNKVEKIKTLDSIRVELRGPKKKSSCNVQQYMMFSDTTNEEFFTFIKECFDEVDLVWTVKRERRGDLTQLTFFFNQQETNDDNGKQIEWTTLDALWKLLETDFN